MRPGNTTVHGTGVADSPVVRRSIVLACMMLFIPLSDLRPQSATHIYDIRGILAPKGMTRYSPFGYSSYAPVDQMEITIHPLFLSPMIDVKFSLWNSEDVWIAGLAGVHYPTVAFAIASMIRPNGIVTPDGTIPHMIAIRSGIAGTLRTGNRHYLSGQWTVSVAMNNDSLKDVSYVDLPMIASSNALFYKTIGSCITLAFDGPLFPFLSYAVVCSLSIFPFASPANDARFARSAWESFGELSAVTVWNLSDSVCLTAGAAVWYGIYRFGTSWNLLPTINIVHWIE